MVGDANRRLLLTIIGLGIAMLFAFANPLATAFR